MSGYWDEEKGLWIDDEETMLALTKHTPGHSFTNKERRRGGENRAKNLSPEARRKIAQIAARKRWSKE